MYFLFYKHTSPLRKHLALNGPINDRLSVDHQIASVELERLETKRAHAYRLHIRILEYHALAALHDELEHLEARDALANKHDGRVGVCEAHLGLDHKVHADERHVY